MINSAIARAVLAASVVCASSAYAGEIRKCVTADGHVTLTDDACPDGTRVTKIISTQEEAAPALAATLAPRGQPAESAERVALTRAPMRYVNLAKNSKVTRGLSLDTETLRAARVNMRVTETLRGQRMASLQ